MKNKDTVADNTQRHILLPRLTHVVVKLVREAGQSTSLVKIVDEVHEICREQGIPLPSRATVYRFAITLQEAVESRN